MRTETAKEAIDRCQREGFSGTIMIHFANGVERKIEQSSQWKPPTQDGTVDLSEVKG